MRLLKKLVIKLVQMALMVALMGGLMRVAKPYIMKSADVPEGMPHFASEESDLMATVFKSALRLFTGQAKRDELAGELSDKLYANRGGSSNMAELGIEMEKPGGKPTGPGGMAPPGTDSSAGGASNVNSPPAAKLPAKQGAPAGQSPAKNASSAVRDALLGRVVEKAKANPELTLIPVVVIGMLLVHLFRRRRSPTDDLMLPDLSSLLPSESDDYEMTHPVHSLPSEDFELLVGLIYQRQGYRVTMPAGRGGGDFMVQRKSEKLLVQCKKLGPDHKVHVDRVRDLHEAAVAAGATRGVYVASGVFSWDARNFAKTKGVTVINARTLDTLLTGARAKPDEDFLAVSEWVPKLMSKVKLTPPLCPTCEATMDEVSVSSGSVWLCSQRPECRGRRSSRRFYEASPTAKAKAPAKPKPQAPPTRKEEKPPEPLGKRARTITPAAFSVS